LVSIDLQTDEIKTDKYRMLQINRIVQYSFESGIYVEFETKSRQDFYAVFEKDKSNKLHHFILDKKEFKQFANKHLVNIKWISVTPQSCFFGRFDIARISLIGVLLLIVIVLIRLD